MEPVAAAWRSGLSPADGLPKSEHHPWPRSERQRWGEGGDERRPLNTVRSTNVDDDVFRPETVENRNRFRFENIFVFSVRLPDATPS